MWWEAAKKFLWVATTGGATTSVGILAFIGMYFIAPSLLLCIGAFLLAAAWEGQVNSEGIWGALERLFDPDHLQLAIAEKYLNDLKLADHPDNLFYKKYKAQKSYIQRIEKHISDLNKLKMHYLRAYDADKLKQIELEISKHKKELENERQGLRRQKLFFLKKLYSPANQATANDMENAVALLIGQNADAIKNEIVRKKWGIRFGFLLSVGAGACTGLATLSALQSGLAAFAVLSAVPGGAIIALAALAGMGYAKLIYTNVSKMIQDFSFKNLKAYFQLRDKESLGMCIFRCALAVLVSFLGLGATIAMAGTWYGLVKDGAQILGAIDKVANTLRNVLLMVMVAPNVMFSTVNSVDTVDKICKSDYKKWFTDKWSGITHAWNNENIIRFANPFRIAEKVVSSFEEFFLVGHVVSMGLSSDRVDLSFIPSMPSISPEIATAVGASSEYFNDKSYVQDEQEKEFILLKVLFLPMRLTAGVLKFFAGLWDFTFSSPRDMKISFEKMYTIHRENEAYPEPGKLEKPEWSDAWERQEIIETCDAVKDRLQPNPMQKLMYKSSQTTQKKGDLDQIKIHVNDGTALASEAEGKKQAALLGTHRNRFPFSGKGLPESQKTVEQAFDHYFTRRAAAAG